MQKVGRHRGSDRKRERIRRETHRGFPPVELRNYGRSLIIGLLGGLELVTCSSTGGTYFDGAAIVFDTGALEGLFHSWLYVALGLTADGSQF